MGSLRFRRMSVPLPGGGASGGRWLPREQPVPTTERGRCASSPPEGSGDGARRAGAPQLHEFGPSVRATSAWCALIQHEDVRPVMVASRAAQPCNAGEGSALLFRVARVSSRGGEGHDRTGVFRNGDDRVADVGGEHVPKAFQNSAHPGLGVGVAVVHGTGHARGRGYLRTQGSRGSVQLLVHGAAQCAEAFLRWRRRVLGAGMARGWPWLVSVAPHERGIPPCPTPAHTEHRCCSRSDAASGAAREAMASCSSRGPRFSPYRPGPWAAATSEAAVPNSCSSVATATVAAFLSAAVRRSSSLSLFVTAWASAMAAALGSTSTWVDAGLSIGVGSAWREDMQHGAAWTWPPGWQRAQRTGPPAFPRRPLATDGRRAPEGMRGDPRSSTAAAA